MRKHHYIALAYVLAGLGVAVWTGAAAFAGFGAFFALCTVIGR